MADYISKQDVIDYLNGYLHSLGEDADTLFNRGQRRALINSIQDILAVKAADVQPIKHGRWENEYLEDDDVWWADCTNCRNDSHSRYGRVSSYAFCPNCGARMDGDTND